jgi:hypothetical protein
MLSLPAVFCVLPLVSLAAAGAAPPARPPAVAAREQANGARDFDFEIGTWHAHLTRRLRPLTGSTEWVEYEGSSIVRPIWGGKANLGELKVSGPTGGFEGLTFRLYEPEAKQWKIRWANAADGVLGNAMAGGFAADGRGYFYDQEDYQGRAIYVRFIFTRSGNDRLRVEQAFSADGGTNWETNWIGDFRRCPTAAPC